MIPVYDAIHNSYDIINLTKEDMMELSNTFNTCPLPQKRVFFKLKKEIDMILVSNTQPKKKL